MAKFKAGDRVICKDALFSGNELTLNNYYTVAGYYDETTLFLKEIDPHDECGFLEERFILKTKEDFNKDLKELINE